MFMADCRGRHGAGQASSRDRLELGVTGALATGYGGVLPALLLVATYPVDRHFGTPGLNARLSVAPAEHGVVTLSVAYRF